MLEVDDIVDVYTRLAKIPTVSSASIGNAKPAGHVTVNSEWKQRDLQRAEKVAFSRTHIVHFNEVFSTPPHQIDEQWNRESASGLYRAVIRKVKDKTGKENQFIEIWSSNHKIHNIDVNNLTQHGKIYDNDGVFGSLEWSNSETHLLYVAEKKVPEAKSFFNSKSDDGKETTEAADFRGEEFVYRQDWGEQMVGKHSSVLCVLDVESGVPSVLENTPDNVSPGQAVWCRDDSGVVCVGWWNEPYRLGIIYCTMRRSSIFHINLKTYECETLSGASEVCVRSPVFSPDYTKLVYLQNGVGGPHNQCSQLMMCDWSNKGVVVVLDVVLNAPDGVFPGLYTIALSRRCWATDNRRVLVQTQWRSEQALVVVDCETGKVERIKNGVGSLSLFDVHNDLVVASFSSLNQPPYLLLGRLCASAADIVWTRLDAETTTLSGISFYVRSVKVPETGINEQYPLVDYEYYVLDPPRMAGDHKSPLLVYIHGGPHSVFSVEFYIYLAGLCLCGYTVLVVNYRGSLGFGKDSVDCLLGNIGTQDVNDVQYAVNEVILEGNVDAHKAVVIGGSHGGFLTAHLIGQFPDFYKAAVCRNPVVNLVTMAGSSDIPDWTFTECGLAAYTFKSLGDDKVNQQLWKRSPIQYVDKMTTPTMIMLGADDRRVPNHQGHMLLQALQARGVESRMIVYPDNSHPINKVDSEADAFVNIVKWFNQHVQV